MLWTNIRKMVWGHTKLFQITPNIIGMQKWLLFKGSFEMRSQEIWFLVGSTVPYLGSLPHFCSAFQKISQQMKKTMSFHTIPFKTITEKNYSNSHQNIRENWSLILWRIGKGLVQQGSRSQIASNSKRVDHRRCWKPRGSTQPRLGSASSPRPCRKKGRRGSAAPTQRSSRLTSQGKHFALDFTFTATILASNSNWKVQAQCLSSQWCIHHRKSLRFRIFI